MACRSFSNASAVLSTLALFVCPLEAQPQAPVASIESQPDLGQGRLDVQAADILHDQMDNAATEGITSQNFELASNTFDSEAADDFVVPTGEVWTIETIEVAGIFEPVSLNVSTLNVAFLDTENGLPGNPVFQGTFAPESSGTPNFVINLPSPPALSPGRYWVLVQANLNFSGGGQWFWRERTVQELNPSAWRNPNGGFGTSCSDWGSRVATCEVGDFVDLNFRLLGTVSPDVSCPNIEVDPGTASGHGWTLGYEISEDDGLVLHDVTLGDRLMAESVSIPYFKLLTDRFSQTERFELTPDCRDTTGRSYLADFTADLDERRLLIEAGYVVDSLPGDPESFLTITQHYEFRPERSDGHCEPSKDVGIELPDPAPDVRVPSVHQRFPCSPYKLTYSYEFVSEEGENVVDLNIPQRVHLTVDNEPLNAATLFIDRDDLISSGFSGPTLRENVTVEAEFDGLVLGDRGEFDNYHQTSSQMVQAPGGGIGGERPILLSAPGCPECAHIHWRWTAAAVEPEFGEGKPIIPRRDLDFDNLSFDYDSNQSLKIGVVRFHPGEEDPTDFTNLISGESVGLADMVFWYSATGHLDHDSFWIHFGFFSTSFIDLEVSITDSPDPVVLPETVTYEIDVTNQGPGDASGVLLDVEGFSFPSFILVDHDRRCSQDVFGLVRCEIGTLRVGETDTVRLEGAVSSELSKVSIFAFAFGEQVDSDETTAMATEETTVELPVDLSIVGSASPDPVQVGDDLTYELLVTNLFPLRDAENVQVNARLPGSVNFVSATSDFGPCAVAGTEVTCGLGSVSNAVPVEVRIVVEPTRSGNLTLTAEVTGDSGDAFLSNNSLSLSVVARPSR